MNLGINFDISLVTMQSLLQAMHRQSMTMSSWISFTSTTVNQSPQHPRHFKLLPLLPRRMLAFHPTSPLMQELAQEVEQERCPEPWQNLSLRGSSSAKIKKHYMAARAVTKHDCARAHDAHLSLQDHMRHPIAFLSKMMGNMHLHQVLCQPDSCQFEDSVIKEINGRVDCKHWEVTPRADVPEDTDMIPSVWAVICKRNLTTGKITKHKARLNLQGGKQEFGMTY